MVEPDPSDDDDGGGGDERPAHMGEGPAHGVGDQLPPGFPHQYFETYWQRISTCETDVEWLKSENDARKNCEEALRMENAAMKKRMEAIEAAFQNMPVCIYT